MKITLEPTHEGKDPGNPNPKVTLEIPGDHWNLGEIMENLIEPLLNAWGIGDIQKHLEDHYNQ